MVWYTRREGVVRGPYPQRRISRYILLGRIRDSDELRPGDGEWRPVSGYPELIPAVMKLPATEENRQKLLIARMREDERRPGGRRDAARGEPGREGPGRPERRRPETPELIGCRELKYQVSHRRPGRRARRYMYPLALLALALGGFMLGLLGRDAEPQSATSNCAARPMPGLIRNNCNLPPSAPLAAE
jgi:hypothetical protein